MPSALITGVNGQDGSYLAELAARARLSKSSGWCARMRQSVSIASSTSVASSRSSRAVCWTMRCYGVCSSSIGPDEIYNFAARASSSQLLTDPTLTAEYNGLGRRADAGGDP